MNQIAERIQYFACATRLRSLAALARLHREGRHAEQPKVQAAEQQRKRPAPRRLRLPWRRAAAQDK